MIVFFTCPFVPAEWIRAHGLEPRRGLPSDEGCARQGSVPMGVCAYAQTFLDETRSPEALTVFTSRCDQMRRAADAAMEGANGRCFLMNIPATWQTPLARRIYHSEVQRLGIWLRGWGGRVPSADELADVMHRFGRARDRLREMQPRLSARRFAERVARFHRNYDEAAVAGETTEGPEPRGGTPVALVGGPLMPPHYALYDAIERHGGRLVFDGTFSGERGLQPVFAAATLGRDPWTTLVDAYFDGIPDPFRRPDHAFHEWLRENLAARGARGLIVWHYAWCDLWRGQIARLREACGVPVCDLDAGDAGSYQASMATRVQAFLEMLPR